VGRDTQTPELLVRCACGFEAQGTEEELILILEEHALEAHNVKVTEEQVLASVRPALPSGRKAGFR
jgi:predicted small metal-binding protein